MAFFEWTADLDTEIPVIDRQHRRIVDYINRLAGAIDDQSRDTVEEVLEELVDYTMTHFTFEEELMEMVDHPYIETHKRTHRLFADKMQSYKARFREGEDVVGELNTTLRSWLINHIKHDDGDYAVAVREMVANQNASKPLKRFIG